MRLILAFILTLLQLAGPVACCCAARPAATRPADTPEEGAACPRCAKHSRPATPTDDRPAPGKPCPCQEHAAKPALAAADTAPAADFAPAVPFADFLIPARPAPSTCRPADPQPRSGRDILRTCHILRC